MMMSFIVLTETSNVTTRATLW